jgi:hypothetical protein
MHESEFLIIFDTRACTKLFSNYEEERLMRMQVFIRDDLAKVLNTLAWRENRWPKQQAEWLLQKALEQAAQEAQPHQEEVSCRHSELVGAARENRV